MARIKKVLVALLMLSVLSPLNNAFAAGENIPLTSPHTVDLTSDVAGKEVPRGDITIIVGNLKNESPNIRNCTASVPDPTCSYSLGLTLTKVPEKFTYDLSAKLNTCILYNETPEEVNDFCNTYQQYGKENQSFGGIKADVQFLGKNTNLQVSKFFQITFNTMGWPGGQYTLMAFSNAKSYGSAKSNPLSFSLPQIPKASLECTGPTSGYSGTGFSVTCNSSINLSSTAMNVIATEPISNGVLGRAVADGNKFVISDIKIDKIGLNKIQVVIPGYIDTLQSSSSNVMLIQIAPPLVLPTLSLKILQSNSTAPAIVNIISNTQSLPVTLQTSESPNGPWKDNLKAIAGGSSKSLSLKTGTWVMAKFVGDTGYQATFSDPVQVLITPIVKCSFPASTKSDVQFTVTCSSNILLPSTPVSLDFQNDGAWKSLTNAFIKGTVSKLKFTLSGNGETVLRISSSGVTGKFSAFVSSKGVTNILAPASSSGSSNNSNSAAPKGKVDITSNAYKTMYTVGKNFAKVSMASDTANSQCNSARLTGFIKANGIPTYLGVQARMLQSYLATASGFKGCLDGFGH